MSTFQALPTLPSERRQWIDPATGVCLTQWTAQPAMHHHFYFTNPTVSRDGTKLFGVTYRFRYPNLFVIDTASSAMRILTMQDDINAFSPAPDKNGERIYYSARDEVRVVEVATGNTAVLARFDGGRLGNCSLSHDDRWLAVSRRESTCRLMLIEVATGRMTTVVEKAEVGHIQFRPYDATTLEYSGPIDARIWTIRSDGSDDRLLYAQKSDEWLTHESWSANGDEIIFTHWPHAVRAVAYPTGTTRTIAEINAWHTWNSPDGSTIVCDTNHPDRGLLLIDVPSGVWRGLCESKATNQGTQWTQSTPAQGAGIDTSIIRGTDPVADVAPHPALPASTYGPQWTHPHPTFSPDGQSVFFTSDRETPDGLRGWSQIYSVAASPDSTRALKGVLP